MPTLTGILETALYVEDVARAARFYQDLFGFEFLEGDDRLQALYVAPRQVLLLFRRQGTVVGHESAGGFIPGHDGSGQSHLAFAIPAGEFDAWRRRIEERGIAVESVVGWERGGRSLFFRDPDGHLLELATPGTWSVY